MDTTQTITPSTVESKPHGRLLNKRIIPYLFISPFFILFLVFGLFPLLFSAYVSLFQWDGISEMNWQGINNYIYVLQLDTLLWDKFFTAEFWEDVYTLDFWRALYNTIIIGLIAGIGQHVVAIPLAYFINSKLKKLRNPVLAIYFLPFITNTAAIALVFSAMFSTQFGVINSILTGIGNAELFGLKPFSILFPTTNIDFGRQEMSRWLVAFLVWWRFVGWNTILYLAALQTIPKDLYEAARIDGASELQQFIYVTLPQLRPMMFFAITLTIIGNLQLFEESYIMMGPSGGVGGVAETSSMLMLKIGMTDGDFGAASAIAWLLFAIIAVLTYVNNKLLKPKD
jgi:multiple sugar transport system permease protein